MAITLMDVLTGLLRAVAWPAAFVVALAALAYVARLVAEVRITRAYTEAPRPLPGEVTELRTVEYR